MSTLLQYSNSRPRSKPMTLVSTCHRCGRTLTDRESRIRGYGPECAAAVAREAEQARPWPVGAAVQITAGWNEGAEGQVVGHTFRAGELVGIQVETMGRTKPLVETYRPSQVERLAEVAA